MARIAGESQTKWKKKNPERVQAYVRGYNARARERYKTYMEGKTCDHCGGAKDMLLHHKDPSTWKFNPAEPRGVDTQLAEWAKCIPLCRKCHAEHHRREEALCRV